MCILCVLSRWSRRFVTMLPWLVIPFIITWGFSQLLPPGYRLEVTSTRLACLGVLLSSLGWYELLMPWLSAWRARRSALLREKRLIEAQEAAKWRKEATRKCRNCLIAYKVQTPGGGKFMCTYCGHVSKRPVLEVPYFSHLPVQRLSKASQSGTCSTGQLINGTGMISLRGCPRSSERRGCIWFGENTNISEHCRAWKFIIKALRLIGNMFSFLGVIWVKVSGAGKRSNDYVNRTQNLKDEMANVYNSRSEKTRRKANEKRQARMERELLEAEERKQREDVARLVEERRRQREEKLHIEKESEREAAAEREREIRRVREMERRRKDKIKERLREQVEQRSSERASCSDFQTCRLEKEESVFRNANITSTLTKSSESLKAAQVSKIRHKQGQKPKCATDDMTGMLSCGLNSVLKTGSFVGKNKAVGSRSNFDILRIDKTVGSHMISDISRIDSSIPPQSMRMSAKSGIDSVWKNSPWSRSNVWKKGTEDLNVDNDNSNMQTGMQFKIDEQLNQNVIHGSSVFNNKTVGSNQSLSSVGALTIQPPIAPPTSHAASLHQLFSTPTIFPPLEPPVDFSNQREQLPQTEVKPSFVPNCTYFDTAACPTLHTCNPVSGLCLPAHPSFCVQSFEGSQIYLRSMSNNGAPLQTDISMQTTCVSEPVGNAEIDCNPISPMSTCDVVSFDVANVSPTLNSMKRGNFDMIDGKGENFIWDFPSIAVEGINNVSPSEQRSQSVEMNETKLYECFQPEGHIDRLPFSHISTVQSLFDSEIILPESLSLSPQKEENPSEGYIYHVLKSAVGIWDDAENLHKVPPEFVDCITQEIMQDPVITADGHSYERSAIEKWLESHDTSPKTGEVLPPPPGGVGVDKTLRPNHILRGQIIEYKEKLAKMQPKALSWSSATKENFIMTPGSFSVLSF